MLGLLLGFATRDLGHWILEESCRQAKAWLDQDFAIKGRATREHLVRARLTGFGESAS